jgi:hypothetical protein
VPTTVLGDWYANILFARPEQLVVCVSERSLLPVVVTAAPAITLPLRLVQSLSEVLTYLHVDPIRITSEKREMEAFAFGRTNNRHVLGTLNEFLFQLSCHLGDNRTMSLLEASLKLARTPCSAVTGAFPDRATLSLFSSSSRSC